MPFCTSCGSQVEAADRFCRSCGGPQPTAQGEFATNSISPRSVSILCYVPWLGLLAVVYALTADRFRDSAEVRFHGFQGLYLFVAWMVARYVFGIWFEFFLVSFFPLGGLLELMVVILWIVMLIKTSRGERFSLPVIGELAEQSI